MRTTVGAVTVFTAAFCALGVLIPGRAMVAGMIYAVVVEATLSFVPAVVNTLTATYYLRSLVFAIMPPIEITDPDVQEALGRIIGGEPVYICVLALSAMVAFFLGLASFVVTHRQYVMSETA